MIMDNNDIDEGDVSDNVSIHSIVSDQEEFDSDLEAPTDQKNQVDKIILNHVVKTIIEPGKGVEKPSKFDYLKIKYKCYFKDDPSHLLIEETNVSDYLFRIVLPYGIVKALKFMRLGEISKVVLEPKYGFRKVEIDKIFRYIDKPKINKYFLNDDPNISIQDPASLESFYDKLKSNTLIYEIELLYFEKIYDLTGKRNLMKQIIQESTSKKIERPKDDNNIILSMKLLLNGEVKAEIEKFEGTLTQDNFSEYEEMIIKSMKKGEISKTDVQKTYFKEKFNDSSIMAQKLKELNITVDDIIQHRIQYVITLINFNAKTSIVYYKDKQLTKRIIQKGIGNVSPWNDAIIMLMIHIKINDKVVYTNLPNDLPLEKFIEKMRETKKKIKTMPFYEQETQFKVDAELKEMNITFPLYEENQMNFPTFFRKKILQSMKLLNIIELTYEFDKENYEDYYMQFPEQKDFELSKYIDIKSDIKYNITLTLCLLNFEENVFVLNNKLETDKLGKLEFYKQISNDFYKKGMLHRAKKLNKKIVDMYVKHINLGNLQNVEINESKNEIEDIKKSTNYDENIDKVCRKIYSNLILILYKMKRIDQCLNYITTFLKLYKEDEKVMFYQYKIYLERGNYENASKTIQQLIDYLNRNNLKDNLTLYTQDLNMALNKIKEGKRNHEIYLKKMMKSISNDENK